MNVKPPKNYIVYWASKFNGSNPGYSTPVHQPNMMSFDDESAGRLMQRELIAVPAHWTVGQVIDYLRENQDLTTDFWEVFVVDPQHHPVGTCHLSWVLRTPRGVNMADVMKREQTLIPVEMDQEEVAYIFDKYHLISAPVVEPGGRLVGQITVDDIVGVIQDESEEDIVALAGVSDAGRDAGVLGIVRSRLPWLILNLLTATVAVSVIAAFQNEIAKLVTLAILMPIVAGVGGNAGTQTLAVAVRALASRELNASNAMRIFLREICVGMIDGAVLEVVPGSHLFPFTHAAKIAARISAFLDRPDAAQAAA